MADFPSGTNPAALAQQVPGYLALSGADGSDRGLAFLQDTHGGSGTLRVIGDRSRPEQVVAVQSAIEYFEVSPDLRYAFVEEPATRNASIAKMDGSGSCLLSIHNGYPIYHPVFSSAPRLMFWGEEAPEASFALQGWYADPDSCAPKRQFTARLAGVAALSDGILYGEYGEDGVREVMTFRHARLADGALPEDGGTVLGQLVDSRFALTDSHQAVFTISQGDPSRQGLYVYGPLP
jgi:hypothetical protein